MEKKGSITIFFTLLLSVIISLIAAFLLSAKVAAGRVQISLAAEQALFSALAKFDRELFEEYHLLYIDGGYGTGTLQLGKSLEELETDVSYLLTPNKEKELFGGKNLLQLEYERGSITGYTLATDCGGEVFFEQVVSYMEDTLGLQGISLLTQKIMSEQDIVDSQENARETNEEKGTIEDYETMKQDGVPEGEPQELSPETQKQALDVQEVLDTVSAVKKTSILNLVLPGAESVSGWVCDNSNLLHNRALHTGMGFLETNPEKSITEDALFQEYILQNINHYTNRLRTEGPAYGVEWILFGKASDIENLEKTAKRLLLIREGANVAGIVADAEKMAQVTLLAEALAAVLAMPYLIPVLEGAIVVAWAYAESLVDVRALFGGRTVALVKNSGNWQVSFAEIPGALLHPEQFYQKNQGLSYEDYLRVLLTMKSKQDKIMSCMEVIELSMREKEGKHHFSMDCAIDTLEAVFQVRSEKQITFDVTKRLSYRDK